MLSAAPPRGLCARVRVCPVCRWLVLHVVQLSVLTTVLSAASGGRSAMPHRPPCMRHGRWRTNFTIRTPQYVRDACHLSTLIILPDTLTH